MLRPEDLHPNVAVRGLSPESLAMVVSVRWYKQYVVEITGKDSVGRADHGALYRGR